jgi:hypothetical protein
MMQIVPSGTDTSLKTLTQHFVLGFRLREINQQKFGYDGRLRRTGRRPRRERQSKLSSDDDRPVVFRIHTDFTFPAAILGR